MLFWAGVSKLTGTGIGWGSPGEFEFLLTSMSVRWSDGVPLQGGVWLLEHLPWVLAFIGPFTLIAELLMPLALIPKLRWLFVGLGLALLVGIRVMIGPNFLTCAGLFIFWIPWDDWLVHTKKLVDTDGEKDGERL